MTRLPYFLAFGLILAIGCGGSANQPRTARSAGGESAQTVSATSDEGDAEGRPMTEGYDSPQAENSPEQPTPMHVDDGSSGLVQEISGLEGDLQSALNLSSLDCGAAQDLNEQICALSERVCGIAEDNPDDRGTQDRCEDGRARCARATTRTEDRCP